MHDDGAVEPDAEAVAALRASLPDELAHLPVASAAEFRREAWKMWRGKPTGNGWYLPWLGIRGVLAMFAGGMAVTGVLMLLFGPSTSASAVEITLTLTILGVVTVLLIWSKRASNRKLDRRLERNSLLSEASARLDLQVELGRIPQKPPGWDDKVPPSL